MLGKIRSKKDTGDESVLFWGCSCGGGKCTIKYLEDTLTATNYCNVLAEQFIHFRAVTTEQIPTLFISCRMGLKSELSVLLNSS